MKTLATLYSRLIAALVAIAAVLLVAMVVAIAGDVVLRGLGFQPPAFTAALAEYGLLYITMLCAPWLVRERGHIVVESLIRLLPPGLRRVLEKLVYLLVFLLCLGLAWPAAMLALESLVRGDIDIRAIDMPRWALFAPLAGGFLLLAGEFLRLLLGHGSLYTDDRGETLRDGL